MLRCYLFATLLVMARAHAETGLKLTAGVGGMVKEHRNASARIVVSHEGPVHSARLFVRAKAGDDATSEASVELSLATRTRKQFELPFFVETGTTEVETELRAGATTLAKKIAKLRVVDERERLLAVVGPDTGVEATRGEPAAIPNAIHEMRNWMAASVGRRTPQVVMVETWNDLPQTPIGLDTLDGLVLVGAPPKSVTPEQAHALLGWVRQGGTLVVFTGDEVSALRRSFLRPLYKSEGLTVLAHGWTGLQHFAGVAEPLAADSSSSDLVAVVRGTFGNGRVAVLSIDPRREPFRSWIGRKQFWTALLRWTFPLQRSDSLDWNLTWRMRDLLHSMDIIQVPPRWVLAAPPLIYGAMLIVVALLVARVGGRKEKSWLILGGTAILFAVVFHLAFRGRVRARAALAGVSVTEVVSGESTARTTLIMNLFSPAQRHLNLSVDAPQVEFQLGEMNYWSPASANASTARREFLPTTSRLTGDVLHPWSMTFVRASFETQLAGAITLRTQGHRDESTDYVLTNGDRYPLLSPRFGYLPQATLKVVRPGETVRTSSASRAGAGWMNIPSLSQMNLPKTPGPRREKMVGWLLDVLGQEWTRQPNSRSGTLAISARPSLAVRATGFDSEWYHFIRVHQPATVEQVPSFGYGLHGAHWVKHVDGSALEDDNTLALAPGETILECNQLVMGNRFIPPPPLSGPTTTPASPAEERKWTLTISGDPQGATVTCGVYNWTTGAWTEWRHDATQRTSPDLDGSFFLDRVARVRFLVRGGKFRLRSLTWNQK